MQSKLSIITLKLSYLNAHKDPAENQAICESIIFDNAYYQGGLNEKETELNFCSVFSISKFNELYLLA